MPVGNVPLGIGVKGQYGFQITVEQVGDHPQPGADGEPPVYEVTFDKNLLANGVIEPPIPFIDPALEVGLQTTGSVTMRFASQEEAARAVSILQRLALEETVRDAGAVSSPASALSSPASNPIPDNSASLPERPNELADSIGPSDEEMAFLRNNITQYTTVVGADERLKLAGKFANLGLEGRFDLNQVLTRTVVLPRDGEQGRLTYTLSGDLDPSLKEKLTIGLQNTDQLEIGYVPQNIVDGSRISGEVSLSWDLPPDAFDASLSGQPVPEFSMLANGDLLDAPDEISARIEFDLNTQSVSDLSRTDRQRLSIEATALDPAANARSVFGNLFRGDLESALRGMDDDFTVTLQNETIRRDGIHQQHEIGVEFADIVEAKASLIGDIGVDDVTERQTATFTAQEIADRLFGPQAGADSLVVVPREGLNVREQPSQDSAKISVFQHGAFVQPTGQTQVDAQGRAWAEVNGLDANDAIVQGWVAAAHLRPHEGGAMDATGRINPELEDQGYETITVQPGDTIWDLARREGVDFREMMELNDHLIDPSLIFPDDKVYVPGTGVPVEDLSDSTEAVSEAVSESAESVEEAVSETAQSVEEALSDTAQSIEDGTSEAAESVDDAISDDAGSDHEATSEATESIREAGPESTGSADETALEVAESLDETVSQDTDAIDTVNGSESLPSQPSAPVLTVDPNGVLPPAQNTVPLGDRQDLGAVLRDYQVATDPGGMVSWLPGGFFSGLADIVINPKTMTATEARLLDGLWPHEAFDMNQIQSRTWDQSNARFPTLPEWRANFPDDVSFDRWVANDGHRDAFRHAYWSAMMTSRFGADFADRFTTAHEGTIDLVTGLPNNSGDREAMDLYNNEVGRRIALENPDASWDRLADLTMQALSDGRLIVIDANGELAWSDQVAYGGHGQADDAPAPAVIETPGSNWR